jgi:hypothetical protein
MPDQTPKTYGTPTGVQAPIQGDRPTAKPLSDEQLHAAYKVYMQHVVAAAHDHFHEHLKATGRMPEGKTSMSAVLGLGQNKTVRKVDEAVDSASQ